MEINNNLNDEIDLRDLIFHLIKSRLIVIVTVFIFAIMTALYSYLSPKPIPIYQTNVKLTVGHSLNKRHNLSHLRGNLTFNFPNMASIREYGDRFIEAKLNGPSVEKNVAQIQELVNFAINDSKEKIELKIEGFKNEISNLNLQIININNSLDLIPKNDVTNNNAELILRISKLEYQKGQLKNNALSAKNNLDANLYLTTNTLEEIKSRQLNSSKDHTIRNTLFSAIAGFLFSIIALVLQYIFSRNN
ncbi:Wzz/FepE/Etk N-terminal domain-containing protein [Candidatus Pseudothioglobus singularis]|nr:Wzz/FepE/Etk N-terminal domain-containing protein [Candidatus Pseudothioglobus singularis]